MKRGKEINEGSPVVVLLGCLLSSFLNSLFKLRVEIWEKVKVWSIQLLMRDRFENTLCNSVIGWDWPWTICIPVF